MKLLICDDDISTIDVLQSQIDCQELGISRILRAYNGEVAMDIIAKELPELILCDIEMPKNTGLEVLRFIYNEELPCELSFITSFESFEFAREAIKYGASRYLTKPLDFDEVQETLSDMIRSVRRKKKDSGIGEEDLVLNGVFRQILYFFLYVLLLFLCHGIVLPLFNPAISICIRISRFIFIRLFNDRRFFS